jgi:coenzyme F420 hydrogenase subunit beta
MNIESVVRDGLCSQCGACASACPHSNIRIRRDRHYRYFPEVEDDRVCMNRCANFCSTICPGLHEDSSLWEQEPVTFDNYEQWCTGKIHGTWIGYAADPGVRLRGSSGGVVTALLTCLLESGRINGALVLGPYNAASKEHDAFIARSREDIESAWGSKYYPMPVGKKFKELMTPGHTYAVVLLGCHMRALRLMERKYPVLKTNILLRIGLICGYCSGFKAIADQVKTWGQADLSRVTTIHYREGKWPGNVRVKGESMDRQTIIYEFLLRLPFTTNARCMICSDLMNETSDITIGDAWLPELTGKRDNGWSVLAVRSGETRRLILEAQTQGYIHLQEVDTGTFIRSQEKPMRYKKHALGVRLDFFRKFMRRRVPAHQSDSFEDRVPVNSWNRLGNQLFLLTMFLFFKRDRLRRFMYRVVPRGLIGWYVRTIFLMIAHDGKKNFFKKLFSGDEPVLNSDA